MVAERRRGFCLLGFCHVKALLRKLDLSESRGLRFLLRPSYSTQALIRPQPLKNAAAVANPSVDEEKQQAVN